MHERGYISALGPTQLFQKLLSVFSNLHPIQPLLLSSPYPYYYIHTTHSLSSTSFLFDTHTHFTHILGEIFPHIHDASNDCFSWMLPSPFVQLADLKFISSESVKESERWIGLLTHSFLRTLLLDIYHKFQATSG